MHIIQKDNIFPIIIPTHFYRDRFGNPNSFVEMNPSLYINSRDGSYTILVRTVNYLKYKNKSFQIYGDSSRSIYSIIRGMFENNKMNLDNCIVESLDIQYNIPTYHSLWYGVEDIRFIDENTVLACIPECNKSSPCIFKGQIVNNILTSFVKCEPSVTEKNWMPYMDSDGCFKIVYSVSPFIIKSVVNDDREEMMICNEIKEELEGWHGSSNGIDFFGETLFLIHKNKDRVVNRWLLLNSKGKFVTFSKEFVFFKDSYFEFVCSLAQYNNKIFVSLGINDNKAFIIELHRENIMQLF